MAKLIRVEFTDGSMGWINPDRISWISEDETNPGDQCLVVFSDDCMVTVAEYEHYLGLRIARETTSVPEE